MQGGSGRTCLEPVAFVCVCPRCAREPDDAFHTSHAHRSLTEKWHQRVRERPADWRSVPILPPLPLVEDRPPGEVLAESVWQEVADLQPDQRLLFFNILKKHYNEIGLK